MSDAPVENQGGPFEEQRRVYDLLSQETRHLILQYILGHSHHLVSLDEFAYLIPKNKVAIRDQLQVLTDEGIIDRYDHSPNEDSRDLPSQFYGLTEYGIDVLEEYSYLDGLPIARALYDNTRLSEKAKRHRDAPRPDLPPTVTRALTIGDAGTAERFGRLAEYIRERKDNTHSIDDQISLAEGLYEAGVGPDSDGIKRTEIAERVEINLDYTLTTILDHLVDIGILEKTAPPGPDVLVISERIDDIVDGNVTEEARENIDALIAHVDDELQSIELEENSAELEGPRDNASAPSVALADGAGRTVRSILAGTFPVDPEEVADYLRSGDPIDRLDEAVDVIEASEEVSKSEDYGRIVFVRPAYRYRLTEQALELV
jgi:DNA-binding HxlR family transcriptional regulator